MIVKELTETEKQKRFEGALKRILEEVKEYRKLPTNMVGGNDIQLVESWFKERNKQK